MKGIILAAGDGDRLGVLTLGVPKALLDVGGRPLIGYPLAAQAAAGIDEIAVVVGYLGDRIWEVLGDGSQFGVRLSYIPNDDYWGGNAVSVHKARQWVQGEPVVLCMADHVIAEGLVKRLVENGPAEETLCVDHSPGEYLNIDEATKVALDGDGCIKNIGKDLARWDALDTGVFLLTGRFFHFLDGLVRRHGLGVEISDAVRFIVGQGHRFRTCDVGGCFWMDVDTKEDLDTVRGRVRPV
ncbi:MAG TPA: NTP transferase domain-containing protein [Dehalococcoidales bacterium]|nr:NTP transferase domain-containing protein [Dehalococcoidales bacterium]